MFNRKLLNIILTILVFVSTTGITIDKHYSNNELYSVSLIGEAKSCCEDVCDCCSNESEVLQLKDNYLVSDIKKLDLFLSLSDVILFHNNLFNVNSEFISNNLFISDRSPPGLHFTSPFLQVFLI